MKPIWFDTTIEAYKHSPKLSDFGLSKATLVTTWGLFRNIGGQPDLSHIDVQACKAAANHPTWWKGREPDMIVLDCEVISLHGSDLPARDNAHDQLIEAVQIYRKAHPGCAIGYYSEMPELNFYGPLYATGDPLWAMYEQYYYDWLKHNKQFLVNLDDGTLQRTRKGLCAAVDRVFPSCYCPSVLPLPANMKWWKVSHDGNVEQALQYQKPVIVYLCPQYDGVNPYFPTGVWREMLEHSMANPNVDGVCVYQNVASGTEFNSQADWWKETLEVVANG